jgi:hypothetical protein
MLNRHSPGSRQRPKSAIEIPQSDPRRGFNLKCVRENPFETRPLCFSNLLLGYV